MLNALSAFEAVFMLNSRAVRETMQNRSLGKNLRRRTIGSIGGRIGMRYYFTSRQPCALRVGGAPVGYLHGNTLTAQIDGEMLCEFLPADGNLFPVSFVLGDAFANAPPACCDVWRCGCYTEIIANSFAPRQTAFEALAQGSAADMQATVFCCGGLSVCVQDKDGFETYPLPTARDYAVGQENIGAQTFLRVYSAQQRRLLLFAKGRKCAFDGNADSFSCGDCLQTVQTLYDIAGHTVTAKYRADGDSLSEFERTVTAREDFSPDRLDEKVLPFAFFQEIAAGGDCPPYLSDAMRARAALLQTYLGNFCAAVLPKDQFYRIHGMVNAVGLVSRREKNLYDVRFFTADISQKKIINLSLVAD